jgi:uncharacterized protein (DUF433 family)
MARAAQKRYVEERDGGYWVAGTRVSLDSIVSGFRDGQSAETIAESFPVLELEQVYGAIAFYLSHRAEIDEYLERVREDYETARRREREADPAFYRRLRSFQRSRMQTE